jgi:hypothetical protein
MAAITSISTVNTGSFSATGTTLSAADTITRNRAKKQLLSLHNPTGGSLTVTIDGDGGTSVVKPGVGSINVSGGYAIVVAAGARVAVLLDAIDDYTKGVVQLTGASGLVAQLFDIS